MFRVYIITSMMWVLAACSVKEKIDDCGQWLEFVFDHNMEYADAFDAQVRSVEVCLFDMDGRLVRSQRGEGRHMLLDGLPEGRYELVAVGNMAEEHFDFTRESGHLALSHNGVSSSDFPHIFFTPTMSIDFRGEGEPIRVPLKRQSNRFNIVLQTSAPLTREVMPEHTAEISAPEMGAYDLRNEPTDPRAMVYSPHSLTTSVVEKKQLTAATINTMRLLPDSGTYTLAVRDIASGGAIWSADLLPLLAASKPARRADGSPLPLAEYLDRQGEWNIIISYTTSRSDPGTSFTALSITINGWIVWKTEMEGV